METVTLDGDTDWPGFRQAARALLARGVPPEAVAWHTQASAATDLFADAPSAATPAPADNGAPALRVPPAFITLCETVLLHSDPGRFGLLYRLL